MNRNKTLNNQINSLHVRARRQDYNNFKSSSHQLLAKDNSVTIHERNLQTLAIETLNVHNNISPEIMMGLFEIKNDQYNFQ